MSLTNYGENALANAWLRGGTLPVPTHIGLLTSDPGEAGSVAGEPSGGSYARVAIGTGSTFWSAASGGTCGNAATVEFPAATGSWGTITHFALFDALSGGNMILSDALSASKDIASGDVARFAAGALNVNAE
jgi:hypothetical protein